MPLKNKLSQDYEKALSSFLLDKTSYKTTLCLMLSELNPSRVTSIAAQMRAALWQHEMENTNGWQVRPQNHLEYIMKLIDTHSEGAILLTTSGNGYIREKAVKQCISVNNSFELALLLIRLNDWVEPVRMAAISKLEALMKLPVSISGLTTETILGCMELILNPSRFGRSREIEFKVLNQLLNINEMPYKLAEFVEKSPKDDASRYLKLGLRRGVLIDALPIIAKHGRHPNARRIASKALLNGVYIWKTKGQVHRKYIDLEINQTEIALQALNDKSPIVQRIALDYIIEFKPKELHKEATYRKFLNDKRVSIVERAIYGLKSLNINYVDELRQKILNGLTEIHSIEVLGRYGTITDGDIIVDQMHIIPEKNEVRALGAAAKLGNKAAMNSLETIAMSAKNNSKARTACYKLYGTNYSPNVAMILHAIHNGKDVNDKGYVKLALKLPMMKLALITSELYAKNIETDYSLLWNTMRQKYNSGMFMRSEEDITALKKSLQSSDELKNRFQVFLGLKL